MGTPAQCADRLVRLAGLGLDKVMILGGFAAPDERSRQRLEASREVLAREVFPMAREKLAAS